MTLVRLSYIVHRDTYRLNIVLVSDVNTTKSPLNIFLLRLEARY